MGWRYYPVPDYQSIGKYSVFLDRAHAAGVCRRLREQHCGTDRRVRRHHEPLGDPALLAPDSRSRIPGNGSSESPACMCVTRLSTATWVSREDESVTYDVR